MGGRVVQASGSGARHALKKTKTISVSSCIRNGDIRTLQICITHVFREGKLITSLLAPFELFVNSWNRPVDHSPLALVRTKNGHGQLVLRRCPPLALLALIRLVYILYNVHSKNNSVVEASGV